MLDNSRSWCYRRFFFFEIHRQIQFSSLPCNCKRYDDTNVIMYRVQSLPLWIQLAAEQWHSIICMTKKWVGIAELVTNSISFSGLKLKRFTLMWGDKFEMFVTLHYTVELMQFRHIFFKIFKIYWQKFPVKKIKKARLLEYAR